MSIYEAFVDELDKLAVGMPKTPTPMFQQQQLKKQWKWANMPPSGAKPGVPPTPKPKKPNMPNR